MSDKKYSNLTAEQIAKLKKLMKPVDIVEPPKSMRVDTTTGMGANIFNIKRKDKPPVKSKMTEIKSKAGDHARKMYLLELKKYEKLQELKKKNKRKSKKTKFK
tara:strand:+ start:261 stop:569 length:309 start_codon:yes stop_codon:yes gene_type:complete